MMFGTSYPKFVKDGVTVLLKYAVCDYVYAQPDFIEHRSIITGKRSYIKKGDYAEFTVIDHLHRYTESVDGKNGKDKFLELAPYHQTTIDEFFPHQDGYSVKDANGMPVTFRIIEMTPVYESIDAAGFAYDKVVITFRSTGYVDLSKIAFNTGIDLIAEDGKTIITEDDKEIQIEV